MLFVLRFVCPQVSRSTVGSMRSIYSIGNALQWKYSRATRRTWHANGTHANFIMFLWPDVCTSRNCLSPADVKIININWKLSRLRRVRWANVIYLKLRKVRCPLRFSFLCLSSWKCASVLESSSAPRGAVDFQGQNVRPENFRNYNGLEIFVGRMESNFVSTMLADGKLHLSRWAYWAGRLDNDRYCVKKPDFRWAFSMIFEPNCLSHILQSCYRNAKWSYNPFLLSHVSFIHLSIADIPS